jgi:hypothetical protein
LTHCIKSVIFGLIVLGNISATQITITFIPMCLNQFTNLLLALLLVALFSGCCSLPMVDCGPKIASVKVQPEKLEIACGDDLKVISLNAWNYLLKSGENVVYLDVSTHSNDLNQYDFKLYFLYQNDTTFLKPSVEDYDGKEPVLRYEVSRGGVFMKNLLHIEAWPNKAGCLLNRSNIKLLVDSL